MEKEVKIQIPEGYEIDREKSTFERIVFKKKGLTYKDVMKALLHRKTGYYIDSEGCVRHCSTYALDHVCEPNAATNSRQVEQVLALNKLMNVAKYLNQMKSTYSSRSGTQKHQLFYSKTRREWDTILQTTHLFAGPTFNSAALARQAIEILGETEVKKAFGIFE